MLQARSIPAVPERTTRVKPASPGAFPSGRHQRVQVSCKKLVLTVTVAACFVLSLMTIAQYSSIVSLSYEISRTEAMLGGLQEEYRSLELDAARLGSLSRVETIAREDLGMREPDQSQLKVLTAGRDDGFALRE